MKKLLLAIAFAASLISTASAATFYHGGVLYGNVCRSGYFYTVYPIRNSQPVGTRCPVRDNFGNVIAMGYVSDE